MKALALTQPWASLVAEGAKRIETRSWRTSYTGPMLIYAAKGTGQIPGGWNEVYALCQWEPFKRRLAPTFASAGGQIVGAWLPRGEVVATCELSGCRPTEEMVPVLAAAERMDELEFGNYGPGRFAWQLDNVRPVEPARIPGGAVSCFQGLFDVPDGLAADLVDRPVDYSSAERFGRKAGVQT